MAVQLGLGGNAGGGAQISGLGNWELAIGHWALSNTIQSVTAPTSLKEVGTLAITFF